MTLFGDNLRRLRERKNVTGQEVAETLGVAKSTYYTWESGYREPGIDTILKLLEYFDASATELFPRCEHDDAVTIAIKPKAFGRTLTPKELEQVEAFARYIVNKE
jgi:transcriptional regulator with XRE-family HTH domain